MTNIFIDPIPADATYGYVVGRWIKAVGDTTLDPDGLPDGEPVSGTVTLIPLNSLVYGDPETPANPNDLVGISRGLVHGHLDGNGELVDSHGNLGVWLVPGAYRFKADFDNANWPEFNFLVNTTDTLENPLDLLTYSPTQEIPGIQMVVSIDTALRAEAAAVRAETAAANLELKEGNYAPDLSGLVPIAQPRNTQTGTEYTLVASDAGKLVTLDNDAAITVTVPANTITVPADTVVRTDFLVLGAGMPTFVGSGGMTVNADPSLVADAQYAGLSLLLLSGTSSVLVGRLATP